VDDAVERLPKVRRQEFTGAAVERRVLLDDAEVAFTQMKGKSMRKTQSVLLLTFSVALAGTAAEDTADRLRKAVTVLNDLTKPGQGIRPEQIAGADCVAVIPGFKKGAAVVGVGYGRGFVSCRNGGTWSAPGAITLETGSLGVQLGGEAIDIVLLSRDGGLRPKLLSDRFAIGSDASAAWGNGKSAHEDPNAKVLFFGQTKGAFAGFGLDGATLKLDEDGNKALYGNALSNREVVEGKATAPAFAQPFITGLAQMSRR
jgi:lipid-binding SYLF domain-containing protein